MTLAEQIEEELWGHIRPAGSLPAAKPTRKCHCGAPIPERDGRYGRPRTTCSSSCARDARNRRERTKRIEGRG